MTSLIDEAHYRLAILTGLLDGGPPIADAEEVLNALMGGWGRRSISLPPFRSHIGDDHSPFEFSIAFAGYAAPELRMLVEAQADGVGATLSDTREASLALNERLAAQYDLPLERFELVRDLFLPLNPKGAFALWHAVCMWSGRRPEFKLYLNPECHGPSNGRSVVREALGRLGLGSVANGLFGRGGYRGEDLDEVRYFSLDLSRNERARVKVYYRHHNITPSEVERAFSYAPSHQDGDARGFLGRMAPGVRVFDQKPIGSCFSFVQGQTEPLAVTLHLPIAHYAANDQIATERVAGELSSPRLSSSYAKMIDAFASRPLDRGAGLQSYASYRREPRGLRTTVYISPEVYQPSMFGQAGQPSSRTWDTDCSNDNHVQVSKRTA